MQDTQIIAGFSDLKLQFSDKHTISGPLIELVLWFHLQDEVLYMHDYHNHAKFIILAVLKSEFDWITFLKPGSLGERLVKHAITNYRLEKFNTVDAFLNEKFSSHGYY